MISPSYVERLIAENFYFQSDVTDPCFSKSGDIDRLANVTYEEFHENYLIRNKPCIFLPDITQNWRSLQQWVTFDKKPNFKFLTETFGLSVVPVANCSIREYNSQQKTSMLLKKYLSNWEKSCLDGSKMCDLYLKDWHFVREHASYNAYKTPKYFSSDWLNEYCEKQDDDYKFVYMGPKGTWTPLHADVFGSYSWSANICGRKRWILFPPGQEMFLKDSKNQLLYFLDDSDLSKLNVHYIDVLQEIGEVLFVPSGWYHQVWNLEDTISINHNWFNACNIMHVCQCLQIASTEVENEISDCKSWDGWEEQVEVILRAHHGMNYEDIIKLLEFIFSCRSNILNSIRIENWKENWEDVFDILSIQRVLEHLRGTCRMTKKLMKKFECFTLIVQQYLQKLNIRI